MVFDHSFNISFSSRFNFYLILVVPSVCAASSSYKDMCVCVCVHLLLDWLHKWIFHAFYHLKISDASRKPILWLHTQNRGKQSNCRKQTTTTKSEKRAETEKIDRKHTRRMDEWIWEKEKSEENTEMWIHTINRRTNKKNEKKKETREPRIGTVSVYWIWFSLNTIGVWGMEYKMHFLCVCKLRESIKPLYAIIKSMLCVAYLLLQTNIEIEPESKMNQKKNDLLSNQCTNITIASRYLFSPWFFFSISLKEIMMFSEIYSWRYTRLKKNVTIFDCHIWCST